MSTRPIPTTEEEIRAHWQQRPNILESAELDHPQQCMDWLWRNYPDDARRVQIASLVFEVLMRTCDEIVMKCLGLELEDEVALDQRKGTVESNVLFSHFTNKIKYAMIDALAGHELTLPKLETYPDKAPPRELRLGRDKVS